MHQQAVRNFASMLPCSRGPPGSSTLMWRVSSSHGLEDIPSRRCWRRTIPPANGDPCMIKLQIHICWHFFLLEDAGTISHFTFSYLGGDIHSHYSNCFKSTREGTFTPGSGAPHAHLSCPRSRCTLGVTLINPSTEKVHHLAT